MANQTRIVLDADDRPKAERILQATGIKTFSQLFSIFLINYGDHLVSALKSPPAAPPPPVTMPQGMPTLKPSPSPQALQAQQFKPMSF